MKKLIYLLLVIGFTATAQNDTITLKQVFIKQYDLASKNAPELKDVNTCIDTGLKYRSLKNDKTVISLYLGNLYYSKTIHFTQPKKEKYVVGKFRGYVSPEDQKTALIKAKNYYQFYVNNTNDFDQTYREAQNGILKIDRKLSEIN